MPRKPIKIPDEPRRIMQDVEVHNGKVTCRNCSYAWFPDPSRWRNASVPNGSKMLYCPYCATKNKITAEQIASIVRRAAVIKQMRLFTNG